MLGQTENFTIGLELSLQQKVIEPKSLSACCSDKLSIWQCCNTFTPSNISAAQNFTPDIVNILHGLIHKALVKYKIGQYLEDYIEN